MTSNISAPAVSTTQSGAPVTSDAHSKAVGADGAIILTDHYLVEKLAQFNRERVPERVVHAKGGGGLANSVVTAGSALTDTNIALMAGALSKKVPQYTAEMQKALL